MGRTDPDSTRVVNPEMLVLARESRGLAQCDLEARTGIKQSKLSKMESGVLPVSEEDLHTLSDALDYPESFFFQADRIYGPSASEFYHRKRASVPARTLKKIHAQLNIKRMHVDRMMRSTELRTSIPRLDPDDFNGNVDDIAAAVRAAWQVPPGPIRSVTSLIEDAGGVIVRMRFDSDQIDAVSWWVPGGPPIFAVNEIFPADRERLTLCHELAHLVMHAVPRPEMEHEANRFAGSFLMPPDQIRADLRGLDFRRMASLKPHWRVSMGAILAHAKRIGSISEGQARWLWIRMGEAGYRSREPAELDFPKESPALLHELVDLHTNDLEYGPDEFADMLNLNEAEARRVYPLSSLAPDPGKPWLRSVK
jgi:Zn-dependent peptidase ImmA (M78 family)/transcriptional regulator with XRE-family HTH domain